MAFAACLPGVACHLQDQAVTESMGPITDYGFEHLVPSDQMITRTAGAC
jgi:hypothetical protein